MRNIKTRLTNRLKTELADITHALSDTGSDCFLFLPINGAGLGHLTRLLAVADELMAQHPKARIVFFTTSIGVHLIHQAGYEAHHVSPMALCEKNISFRRWEKLFQDQLELVLKHVPASTLVFDGSTPYPSLLKVISEHKNLKSIWVKRGLNKGYQSGRKLDQQIAAFDHCIVPGELGIEATKDSTCITETPPIVYKIERESLNRADAAERLGLNPNDTNLYIQLGAGNINDIGEIEKQLIELFDDRANTSITIGDSPISINKNSDANGLNRLTLFPNSIYFNAFDVLFLAAGYNSAHEAAFLSKPTVFFPNESTGSDNQRKRAENISSISPALVVKDVETHKSDIADFVDKNSKKHDTNTDESSLFTNGAREAAARIIEVHKKAGP